MVYSLMFLPNGFYKGKQTNKQFFVMSLSRINFISLIQETVGFGEGVGCGFL